MQRSTFLVLAMVLLMGVPASAATKVTRKPPKVEYKHFDPANKPADMPKMNPGEIAFCKGDYDIQVQLVYAPSVRKVGGKYVAKLVVDDVIAEIALTNQIWLPHGASDKLKAHEEGHRQIAEMIFNTTAEKAVRAAADKLDGRKFEGQGATAKEARDAADAAMKEAHLAMVQSYHDMTSRAGQKTQELYDRITAHGVQMDVTEAEAIARAFAHQPPPFWPKPATQPATKPVAPATRPVR